MANQSNLSGQTPLSYFMHILGKKIEMSNFLSFVEKCAPYYSKYTINQLEEMLNEFHRILDDMTWSRQKFADFEKFSTQMKFLKAKIFDLVESKKGFFKKLSPYHFHEIREYIGEGFPQFNVDKR